MWKHAPTPDLVLRVTDCIDFSETNVYILLQLVPMVDDVGEHYSSWSFMNLTIKKNYTLQSTRCALSHSTSAILLLLLLYFSLERTTCILVFPSSFSLSLSLILTHTHTHSLCLCHPQFNILTFFFLRYFTRNHNK